MKKKKKKISNIKNMIAITLKVREINKVVKI